MSKNVFPKLKETIDAILGLDIPENRREKLQILTDYVQQKLDQKKEVHLNFICTHNSRRSQLSQIWAQTVADQYGIPVKCYSGGVEVTAFNERAVNTIQRSGFQVSKEGQGNPVYKVSWGEGSQPIKVFSKLFDDKVNSAEAFAAVMTCSHADENCPFIPGTEKRIALNYQDPKDFDGTPQETSAYEERSMQIASEMFYVFSRIKANNGQ